MKFPTANLPSPVSTGRAGGKNWKCRAFTLIEIMVAIAVFTMVIGAIYSSWILLIRSTQASQDVAAQAQRQRITLRTIEDSLMAVQSFQASPQYYSFVVEGGTKPLLSFTAKVPENFPRNGKFNDPLTGREFNLRRLTFSVEPGDGGENNLVLRQNPILMDLDKDEQQYPLVLARNVRKFDVECWDTNKLDWVTEWENTNAIPTLMLVNLVLGGNTAAGSSAPDVSVARLFSLPAGMMPAAAQNGSAAGGPGGPGLQIPGAKPGGSQFNEAPIQVNPYNPPRNNSGGVSGPGIVPPQQPFRSGSGQQ
jgi:prepilin-type N-terminal cleavage/methylation domain-containing protein